MISKWKYNYTDEEKGMVLTIQSQKQEIEKLVDELEEQEQHIKEANFEIERLNNLLKETGQTLSEQTTKAITLKSENERLNKELKSLQDSYDIEEEQANYHINLTDDLREEVDRLNNIINEFNKLIENEINRSKLEDNYERVDSLEYCLATLKELKGEDKE